MILLTPKVTTAQVPDGTIQLSGGHVAASVAYSWGSGTLTFQDKRYPLNVSGIGVGSVGVTEYFASGRVTGLKSPQDINGIFVRIGGGLTLDGGGGIAAMQNQNVRMSIPEPPSALVREEEFATQLRLT